MSPGMRPKGTAAELERRRRRAVALVQQGYGIRQAAAMVGASPGPVSQWWAAYRRGGRHALDPKPNLGRPPKLSRRQRVELVRMLRQGPTRHGYANELWTLKRLAELIQRHWGIGYDPSGVWHVLRGLGWSCQKPQRRARERDENAIVRWQKQDWPRIKKRRAAGPQPGV